MTNKALPVVVLGLIVWLAQASVLRPTDTETANEVERTRAAAVDYTKRMPDFICTQTLRRFIRLTLPKTWQPVDVLSVKLSYSDQTEDRKLIQRNGEAVAGPEDLLGGLVNIGEFGGMLEGVFDRQTEAVFHWESWKTVHERPVAVYSYRVPKSHSLYMLTFNPGGYRHKQVVGYHGTIEVDRDTGGVLRLVYEADTIPKDFPMQYASTTVDYEYTEIAGKRYLLPARSEAETGSDVLRARNVSEFTGYRKFSSDSTVRFGDTLEKQ